MRAVLRMWACELPGEGGGGWWDKLSNCYDRQDWAMGIQAREQHKLDAGMLTSVRYIGIVGGMDARGVSTSAAR